MMEPIDPAAGMRNAPLTARKAEDAALMKVARDLETTFLTEMLKAAGFGEARESFGGGAGEEQFASFLRAEHAKAMVDRGGIGLSESIFNALKGDKHDTP